MVRSVPFECCGSVKQKLHKQARANPTPSTIISLLEIAGGMQDQNTIGHIILEAQKVQERIKGIATLRMLAALLWGGVSLIFLDLYLTDHTTVWPAAFAGVVFLKALGDILSLDSDSKNLEKAMNKAQQILKALEQEKFS